MIFIEEIWKPIEGYENYYISNLGNVKNIKGKLLCLWKDNVGYLQVKLSKEGKWYYKRVHRLVAEAFIPNPHNLPCVNHKDENKENNSVENLEWCDYVYNANYGTGIERSKEKRLGERFVVINLDTGEVYQTPKDASRETGIHNDSISKVCKGKSKTAGGYRWRYLNE